MKKKANNRDTSNDVYLDRMDKELDTLSTNQQANFITSIDDKCVTIDLNDDSCGYTSDDKVASRLEKSILAATKVGKALLNAFKVTGEIAISPLTALYVTGAKVYNEMAKDYNRASGFKDKGKEAVKGAMKLIAVEVIQAIAAPVVMVVMAVKKSERDSLSQEAKTQFKQDIKKLKTGVNKLQNMVKNRGRNEGTAVHSRLLQK